MPAPLFTDEDFAEKPSAPLFTDADFAEVKEPKPSPENPSLAPVFQRSQFEIPTPPRSELPGVRAFESAGTPAPSLEAYQPSMQQRLEGVLERFSVSPEERAIAERSALGLGDMSEKALSLALPKETARRLGAQPYGEIQAPRISAEQIEKYGAPGIIAKPAAALEQAGAGLVDFLTSAEGVMSLMGGMVSRAGTTAPAIARLLEGSPNLQAAMEAAKAGKGLERGIAGAFAADMASHAPDQLISLTQSLSEGDVQGAVADWINAGMQIAATKHAVKGGEPSARSIKQAAEVYGDVQPFPVEGVREMPAEEGGGRIQPSVQVQEEVNPPQQRATMDDITKKGPNEQTQRQEEALRETVAHEPGAAQAAAPGLIIPEGAKPEAIALANEYAGRLPELEKAMEEAKVKSGAATRKVQRLRAMGKTAEAANAIDESQGATQDFQRHEEAVNILKNQPREPIPAAATPERLAPSIEEGQAPRIQPSAAAVGIAPPGTELAQRIIEWSKTLPAKLAGKSAPLTSRASEQSGNALIQFASAKTAAPLQAKSMATDVLGEHFKDADFSKKLGAVLVEDRLRTIPNEQAGTIIGKEYSPFKTEAEYQAALKDPEIQAAIERHKQTVQQEAQSAHEATGGELAGPGLQTGAFVNLKAVMPGAEEFFGGTSMGNLENPLKRKTRFGKQAKGTAQEYELDYRTLAERMIQGNFEELSKRNLYKQLVDDGLAIVQKPGLPAPKIGGKPTVKFTVERRGGNVEYLWLRKDLAAEFEQAENVRGPIEKSALIHVAQALNRIQLAGPTDAVWHVANMMASIAGSQGGKNVLTDLARKFPGVNVADAVGRITASAIKVLADDPEIQRQLADIAKIGSGREAHPGGFLSRSINLIDKAGRLVRDNMYQNLVDRGLVEANEATRREWINQLGQYNGRLMSQFQRIFKEAGFSPFIVAGRNFNRMAARRITLDPGIKAANPAAYWEMKGIEAFGIMATLVAVPSLINLATTGKPSGRPGVKFGQIDTGKDDANGKHIIIDPSQWTGLRRGLRISGAQSVIEGLRQGQPHAKIAKNAITDVLGGIIHPWAGPAVSAPVIFRTGYSPTGFKESESPNDYGANLKAALKQLNPVAEAAITGYENKEGPAKYTAPITAIGKSLGGAAGIKQVAPFTAQSEMYNAAHRWMEKSGDPKLLKKFEHDLNTDYGQSDYKPLKQALQANDTQKAKAEIAKLKEFKSKSDIMKAMRNAVTRSFSGSKATESKFLKSLTEEQRQQYNKAKEERREEYRRFREVWTK